MISLYQSADVKDRLITENICLPQELILNIFNKAYGGNMIMKLDMEKAFDRVNWNFLFRFLRKIGFSEDWINLILACLSHVNFSVQFLSVPKGHLSSTRGLRQGDPLSPFLFILAAEVLSRGLAAIYMEGNITYFCTPRACLPMSHFLYADNTLIFLNKRLTLVNGCMKFLQWCYSYSG